MVKHHCKNIGCNKTFKFLMNLNRHLPKSNHLAPVSSKLYKAANDKFKCGKCKKMFSHESSAVYDILSHAMMVLSQKYNAFVMFVIIIFVYIWQRGFKEKTA